MKSMIWHNPRCSKSRQTLEILKGKGIAIEVVEYLKNPPSTEELAFVCARLPGAPLSLLRTKENMFKELGLSVDDQRSVEEWIQWMGKYPVLIERPVVVYNDQVALGRPPESVLMIL